MLLNHDCPGCGGKEDLVPEIIEIKTKERLRIWDVDHFFKCPLIGMCLTHTEQRQLLKKLDFPIKKASAYMIHEALVASTESDNRISRRIDIILSRRYGKDMDTYFELGSESFFECFKEAFKEGDFQELLWIAAVKPDLNNETKRKIFGEIHMAMHFSAEESMRHKRKAASLEKDLDDMRGALKNEIRLRKEIQKDYDCLKKETEDQKNKKEKQERKMTDGGFNADKVLLSQYSELHDEYCRLKDKVGSLKNAIEKTGKESAFFKGQYEKVMNELAEQNKAYAHFRKETGEILGNFASMSRCDGTCPSYDLCKKRVLIVGGITKMESLYRELIEKNGGIFEYHDGYMNKGVRQLETRLKRADVVLCPVSCNSHAACSIVKNLAKKHNKTVHMMASSSLAAVTQVICGGTIEIGSVNASV